MHPRPLYTAKDLRPSYRLYYDWTGWPSGGALPALPAAESWTSLLAAWEEDGLRLLEKRYSPETVHLTFSTTPGVSPVFLAARAKGRLQHALRTAGTPVRFSRKVSVRSVGKNTAPVVETYLREQVKRSDLADPRYAERLEKAAILQEDVDVSKPTCTDSGRYWYNLHIVLVTCERHRTIGDGVLATMRKAALASARKKGHVLRRVSFMPDHVHLTLRANIEESPEVVVLGFQNNLAYAIGQLRVWMDTYYVGTFGEYDMKIVRR